MRNRIIRKYITFGYKGKIILNIDTPIEVLNSNKDTLNIISRYNRLLSNKELRVKLKEGYKITSMFNNIGTNTGFYFQKI